MGSQTVWNEYTPTKASDDIQKAFPNRWVQLRLAKLGIQTIQEANAFLNPDHYQPSRPEELPDMQKATARLLRAVDNKERVGVWGDFDVDGQTSTTLLVEALTSLGLEVVYHIPNRKKESHGIKLHYLQEFLQNQIQLLVTCDTGISEHESVAYAQQSGIDVILTDHHSLPETLPEAFAVINPQRLIEEHPLHHLAGVGTAYKLIENLYQKLGLSSQCEKFLDLVALGTIADVALLTADNRYLVQKGLQKLKSPERLGLKEIYRLRKIESANFSETTIGFILGPMLNALGRLEDANPIVDFLTTRDKQSVATFAQQLNQLNEERKFLTEQITQAALFQMEREPEINASSAIVIHNPYWEAGVLGIVANRLVEIYQKPVILLTGEANGSIHGSARSVAGVDIIAAIRSQKSHLLHFGGHLMAAGLSLNYENLGAFTKGFCDQVKTQLGDKVINDEMLFDGEISFDQITSAFVRDLEQCSPFGPGNPAFLFVTKNIKIQQQKKIGKNLEHLRLAAVDANQNEQEILWWRGDSTQLSEELVDIAYHLSFSIYRGEQRIQLEMENVRISENSNPLKKTGVETIEIIDLRKNFSATQDFIKEHPNIPIWYESRITATTGFLNLERLYPNDSLLILFPPANLSLLRKGIAMSHPSRLVLGNFSIEKSNINALVKDVAGMVVFAIDKNHGLLDYKRMANLLGITSSIIETSVLYLQAAGKITIHRHPDTLPRAKIGGVQNVSGQTFYQTQLNFLLYEMDAFRKWFYHASIDSLKEAMKGFF